MLLLLLLLLSPRRLCGLLGSLPVVRAMGSGGWCAAS